MANTIVWLDGTIARILGVSPRAMEANTDQSASSAERAFGFSLLFSGIRCILQYAIFPFVLPLVGIASAVALPISLAINVVAIISIVFSLRRFWKIRYARRWEYLVVAIVALIVMFAFLIMEVNLLLNPAVVA